MNYVIIIQAFKISHFITNIRSKGNKLVKISIELELIAYIYSIVKNSIHFNFS